MRIALLSWTLCGLIRYTILRQMSWMATCHHRHQIVLTTNTYHLRHQTVAGLMVIVHRHRLMVCILTGRHLHRLMGKAITSQITCVVLTLHLRMTWMIMA